MATTLFVDGVSLTAAAWFNDVDTNTYPLTAVGGTANAITATGPSSFTAYGAGKKITFTPTSVNTGPVTINISALGTRNIFLNGVACVGGELQPVPTMLYDDGTQLNIMTQKVLNGSARATVASASTTVLDTTTSNYAQITGTTSITAITLGNGRMRFVEFDGALTLTHGASLQLPGAANITTAQGDCAIFIGEASSVVRCVSYTKVAGTAIVASGGITLGTPAATTSGTAIDYSSIPAGTKRITAMFRGVSTNGVSPLIIQIGPSGGVETSGYNSATTSQSGVVDAATTGCIIVLPAAAKTIYGQAVFNLENSSSNAWSYSSAIFMDNGEFRTGAGTKTMSGSISKLRFTMVNGTDAFDAGEVNISYE